MKNLFIISVMALGMAACATSATKATNEQLTLVEIKEVNATPKEAYDRALQWFAENLNNANQAVQIRDEKDRHIVSNLETNCTLTNGFGADVTIPVNFTVDFVAKDKKIKVQSRATYYELDIPYRGRTRVDITDNHIEKIRICNQKIAQEIAVAVESKPKTDW